MYLFKGILITRYRWYYWFITGITELRYYWYRLIQESSGTRIDFILSTLFLFLSILPSVYDCVFVDVRECLSVCVGICIIFSYD